MPNGSCLPLAASRHIFGRDGIGSARPDGEPKWPSASRSGIRSPSSTLPPEIPPTPDCSIVTALKATAPLYISTNVTVPTERRLLCPDYPPALERRFVWVCVPRVRGGGQRRCVTDVGWCVACRCFGGGGVRRRYGSFGSAVAI